MSSIVRITLILLSTLWPQACAKENVRIEPPIVDKRVELISLVFRLAEKQEYAEKEFKLYTDRIDRHFEEYKNHELIQFTRFIIKENDIAFDGPMWLAAHLDEDLKLLPEVKEVWQLDPRWTEENVHQFVLLLQQFREDSQFDRFFKENKELYAELARRFTPIYEQVDLDWYASFFGKKPTETFAIRLGPGILGNCFGVNVDYLNGERKVYAVMGMWMFDQTGFPEFSTLPDLGILTHEFCHPFVDHLTEKHREAFRESGEKIYAALQESQSAEAYTSWEVILDEVLINAAVIQYMKDHDFEQSEIEAWINLIKYSFGFYWVENLADALESYEQQRDKYPTLDSFMPELAKSYKAWTK
ncbi:DUF4932 domain-containing protein [Parabacteroides sp. PF5-6]|uniref:DUF4932 domain-containing protein n=1 Tax=Parabacteroides sp. PF5-6 TaxID=1742403 RepID=UPI002404E8CF|nr:DUF4932 domain-containing protein [Parabacteroides sp. PF5-6]MDF9830303.1 hypothetical protein [Parabacteroides sp. PF5-6]